MKIENQQTLLAKYDFLSWEGMAKFFDKLPGDARDECKVVLTEGRLVAKTSLQLALDVADASSRLWPLQ